MKKNILIISYGYPPLNDAGAQRPYALAKNIDKSKYNIQVITCENPTSSLGINKNFNIHIEGVELIKIRSYVGGTMNDNVRQSKEKKSRSKKAIIKGLLITMGQKVIFPDKGVFWFPNVKNYFKNNPKILESADIVISTSPGVTNHRIAAFIKKQNSKVKWVADFRDFNYVEHWESKKGMKAFLHKRLEKSIVEKANHLTFVTRTMQNAYQEFYPAQSQKMHCVYNGFDKSDFPDMEGKQSDAEKLTFFYAGTFYNGLRSPFPLLQLLDQALLDKLISKDEVRIQIAGKIDEEIRDKMKNFQSFHNVTFLGNIPRTEVIKYMANTTFLWLIVANIKAHYQTIPIKLFEYIAARRPIVNFAPSAAESSQIIADKRLGYSFETLEFEMEKAYPIFKKIITDFREGSYKQSLPVENVDSFVWGKQIKLIENLL